MSFPSLDFDWLDTRDTLRSYSQVLGSVRRALTERHPRWWNISLQAHDDGLTTGPIQLPDAELELTLDLQAHRLRVSLGGSELLADELAGLGSSERLAATLTTRLDDAGVRLSDDYHSRGSDDERAYEPRAAERYREALLATERVFAEVRSSLDGETGPIQLWPHHFDLSFEWFGTRMIEHQEDGESVKSPSQIGYGFSTGDDNHAEAYYYATPWPFDDELAEVELPAGARWLSEPWEGALLPYSDVAAAGPEPLRELLERVFRAAAPGLRD